MNSSFEHDHPAETGSSFDPQSGSRIERLLFNNRFVVLSLCILFTLLAAWQLPGMHVNASFEKTIPTQHPFIVNYLAMKDDLPTPNLLRVALEPVQGDIYDAKFLDILQQMTNDLIALPGVDRPSLKSIWTPNARWQGITEEGFDGGPLIPDGYQGKPQDLQQLRINVQRSGEIGQIVSLDEKSALISVPLLADNPQQQRKLDYGSLDKSLESLRTKYEQQGVKVHISGFAKVVGDLIDGLYKIAAFFLLSIILAATMLYFYTRCVRSTLLVVLCSLTAVVWQLGCLPLLGFDLNPYSVLVPFLVFAIGMSHGAQKMNGIMQDVGRGMHKLVAARFTFRRLFLAGLTALLCDAVGFGVLMVIHIEVIQELAIIASLGVGILIFTNLIMLPILLSYVGVSQNAAERSLRAERGDKHFIWHYLGRFTQPRRAAITLLVSAVIGVAAFATSLHLKIGDLDPGAPELRPDSRYNRDNAYIDAHYGASGDVFIVMVRTPEGECASYDALTRVDALDWQLQALAGVESTRSLASQQRLLFSGYNEGNPKWLDLPRNRDMLNTITSNSPRGLYNANCSVLPVTAFLHDHRADTLSAVVETSEAFAQANHSESSEFLLAAGSAGIEAATNIVVRQSNREMLFWVYGAVTILCFLTFRSWRAVVCAMVPLALTSLLCEALMVILGIGVKVATLPVIALGVGIGVDYALYVMSIMLARLRAGEPLAAAYETSLLFTGRIVMLTAFTLAVGVAVWAWSPIKFQADMGILLAFMFIGNMVGALVLIPALAHFLLKPSLPGSSTQSLKSHSDIHTRKGAAPPVVKTAADMQTL
ncbi:MMPL family transporter [Pseudomonas sp.]|uniref:efflux RND transporter permease subunit n=1 Tax=Pseudomonas sp. TaxID=306 RepID=UPI0026159D6D|nr:MMPL family transporter [Pseudomonas sp.]